MSSASISSYSTSSASSYVTQAQYSSEQPTKNAENSSQEDSTIARLFVDCSITAGLTLINPWAAGAYGFIRGVNLVHKVVNNFFSVRKAAAEALIKQKEALIKQQEEAKARQEQETRAKQEKEAREKQEQIAKAKQEEDSRIRFGVANALKAKLAAEEAAVKEKMNTEAIKATKEAAEAKKVAEEAILVKTLINDLGNKKHKPKETPSQAISSDVTAVDIPPQKRLSPELQNVTTLSQNSAGEETTNPENNYKPLSTYKKAKIIAITVLSAITLFSSSFIIKSRFFNA